MARSKSFEKPKDKKKTLQSIFKYLLLYKWRLAVAFILTLGSNMFALVGPLLSGYAIDAIEPGLGKVDFQRVFYYIALMLVFYAVSAVLAYILKILMIHISRNVARSMRKDVFDKLMVLPIGYFDTHQTGDIISRISYDIDTVNTSLSGDVIQVASGVITVVGAFAMMLALSPPLVLIFAVTVPASVLWSRYLIKKTRPLFRARSKKLGELNGFAEESITSHKTILAYGCREDARERFEGKNKAAVDSFYKAEYYGGMMAPTVNFINNISLALIILFGALSYMSGTISIGGISSFILYSRRFSGPINETANTVSDLQSAMAAAERIFDLLSFPAELADIVNAGQLEPIDGNVVFNHVGFEYTPGKPVINDFTFGADAGKLIAIVGSTGAGKTTVVNLLMRFYDIDKGDITIDKKNITYLTRGSVRSSFSMVLQDAWLFHGSIFENLVYGKKDATMEDVVGAAKAAGIHSFIMRLPDGYDTLVNNEDACISKGQKQLLTIARAMLLDTNMLILDEATSNVDTRTEQKIQKAMRRLMENKTCFIIAHRLSTIKNADTIIVMEHGEIIQQGTHDELVKQKGQYRQLYLAQFD